MKALRTKPKRTIVVDFGRGSIKIALAESAGEAVRFREITAIPMGAEHGEDDQLDNPHLVERLREVVKRRGWRGMRAGCLLSRSATSTQSFLFPPMPDKELRQAIEIKLEETLHFSLEEASFGFRRIRETESGGTPRVLTLVAAARKKAIFRALSVLREAGLRPVAIGAAAESLANLAYHARLCNEEEATVHVDIGEDSTILNLFDGRLLRFSREVDVAGSAFTAALMRPIITANGPIQLDHDQANQLKLAAGYPRDDEQLELPHGIRSQEILPLLEPVVRQLSGEINRSIDYLRGILERDRIDRIVLSGSAAQLRNLDAQLQENLGISVVRMDPVARATAHWRLSIQDSDVANPEGFSAILGYSLGHQEPINLLPREEWVDQMLQQVTHVRRMLVPPVLAGVICLALAGMPASRSYLDASKNMRLALQETEQCIQFEMRQQARWQQVLEVAEDVALARGAQPDWASVLKEISRALPEQAQILSLKVERQKSRLVVRVTGQVHAGALLFEELLADVSVALGTSPFFENLRVVNASASSGEPLGEFDLTVEITAGPAHPFETEEEP